jgi:hypothetical protein
MTDAEREARDEAFVEAVKVCYEISAACEKLADCVESGVHRWNHRQRAIGALDCASIIRTLIGDDE